MRYAAQVRRGSYVSGLTGEQLFLGWVHNIAGPRTWQCSADGAHVAVLRSLLDGYIAVMCAVPLSVCFNGVFQADLLHSMVVQPDGSGLQPRTCRDKILALVSSLSYCKQAGQHVTCLQCTEN
jgi:hypothetical protein